jgi:hypothetical protein
MNNRTEKLNPLLRAPILAQRKPPITITVTTSASNLLSRIRQMKEEVEILKELFTDVLPVFVPDDRQFRIWLQRYDLDTVAASIERTAAWYNEAEQTIEELKVKGKPIPTVLRKTQLDIIKYASGVMKGKTVEAQKKTAAQVDTTVAAETTELSPSPVDFNIEGDDEL